MEGGWWGQVASGLAGQGGAVLHSKYSEKLEGARSYVHLAEISLAAVWSQLL